MSATVAWDVRYEWKAVTILSLGFGLVSVDRFMLMPAFPTIKNDLNLNFTDLGIITGALAVAWGLSALFLGNLSDRIGHRKVLISSMLCFSLLVGTSGLANGLLGLVVVRVLMGFADGAYTAVGISSTVAASKPSRHGLNVGLFCVMSSLLGLGIAPIVVTQLLQFMNWRWVFLLLMVPGLLVTLAAALVLREHGRLGDSRVAVQVNGSRATMWSDWRDVLRLRNPKILMFGSLCWFTSLIVIPAMLPNYLTDVLGLSTESMGFALSGLGFGSVAGCLVVPWLSDRWKRKPVMLLSVAGAFAGIWAMLHMRDVGGLFACFFVLNLFTTGLTTLTIGPLSAESVPSALTATCAGLVIGAGEIVGGGFMPVIGGLVAERYGVQYVFYLPLATLVAGFAATLFLEETAPTVALAGKVSSAASRG